MNFTSVASNGAASACAIASSSAFDIAGFGGAGGSFFGSGFVSFTSFTSFASFGSFTALLSVFAIVISSRVLPRISTRASAQTLALFSVIYCTAYHHFDPAR